MISKGHLPALQFERQLPKDDQIDFRAAGVKVRRLLDDPPGHAIEDDPQVVRLMGQRIGASLRGHNESGAGRDVAQRNFRSHRNPRSAC